MGYGKNVSGMKGAQKAAGLKKVAAKTTAPKKIAKAASKLKRGK